MDSSLPISTVETATTLFELYRGRVFGIALCYAPAKDLAEDVVQQVYLEFVTNFHRWDLEGDIGALLNVMARNFARRLWQDRIRQMPEKCRELARRLQVLSESRQDDRDNEIMEHLKKCLESLPESEKQLLYQHYQDKKTIVEIAGKIRKDPATLRSVFARIRKKLKNCIESKIKQGEER